MNRSTVIVDACVLYPAPLRDLIMQLVVFDLFRVRWTEEIHAEWMNSLLSNRPDLSRDRLERTRRRMDHHALDALVTGYETLIPSLTLPDPNDRHVLAAAIRCSAELIVTNNLKDFPSSTLSAFGIEAQLPDAFFLNLLFLDRASVLAALKVQRGRLKNPPKLPLEFLDKLEQQQLPVFVAELRRFADIL